MRKLAVLKEGEIYAIPLFVSEIPSNKSFIRQKIESVGKEFAYCRVIENRYGSGYLVEVFNVIGDLEIKLGDILSANRLFDPIAISGMGVTTKRWKKIFQLEDYDKDKDSNYSEIKLVLGTGNEISLWQNGKETPISEIEAKRYEPWKIWLPSQLEKRIIQELSSRN